MKIFTLFSRKKSTPLTSEEVTILAREDEEARNNAMPSNSSSILNDGPLVNGKFRATVNHSGPSAVVSRRATEPRDSWREQDKDEI